MRYEPISLNTTLQISTFIIQISELIPHPSLLTSQILIYNDDGASKDSVTALLNYFHPHITAVTGQDLQNPHIFQQTSLFIMPGGRSLPYYEKLGEKGNQNIIDYVKKGGCYLGICAGAYYACKKTLFAEGLPLALNLPGALNFFEGAARGPVFADKEFAYGSENGALNVDIIFNEKNYSVYFNGGCTFEDVASYHNVHVIASYAENKKPAAIYCKVNKGCAILSGVHPELRNEV